ncbi:MAG: type II secretion system major pseudopilin GspG [Gammaproteobacteria bacterium]|nr:type II secretion system major pseudopilin GspG [Gammaproteobacteria bacterium]MCY4270434.1 type II secretion system major pseudopilin GspG [Gammaproteobacteria bacterium]MCY4297444.1 type II secretion system major pseudopilin GspG [Gammaproteobacteria bacterium]
MKACCSLASQHWRRSPGARSSGFTLIEILVVMAIIAMLAVLVAPNIFNQQAGAMRDAATAEISTLSAALDMYRLDVGRYPNSLDGLVENDADRAAWNGPYLRGSEIPDDPWENPYVYEPDDNGFALYSLGADGADGGEGNDADIGR